MPATRDRPPPVNHIFVDFENVHEIDLSVIGSKAVSFTLLVGPRQTKLDVSLVEKLFEHAVSVQLVRLTSAGRNGLDFTLAYYVGRAVAADPDAGFVLLFPPEGPHKGHIGFQELSRGGGNVQIHNARIKIIE